MRTFLIAVACVVLASPVSWAAHGLRHDLAKPNTSIEQFKQDRADCLASAEAKVWRHASRARHKNYCGQPNTVLAQGNPSYVPSTHPWGSEPLGYHTDPSLKYEQADHLFVECMRAKGYAVDQPGHLQDAQFHLEPLWR